VALEWSVAGVLAVVTGELIRTGELPAATFPIAMVGLLTGMGAHVCLEMR